MHGSYFPYVIPEGLNERHPYIQDPFTPDVDPTEITEGAFYRTIPKLAEALEYPGLSASERRDALKTLNCQVRHQETKDKMISYNLVAICAKLLTDKSASVREQSCILLGSLVHSVLARDCLPPLAYMGIQQLINDDVQTVRECCGWALLRLSESRDGALHIVKSKTTKVMILAFIKATSTNFYTPDNQKFIIYLLECFANITTSDLGIMPLLATGIIPSFKNILLPTHSNDYGKHTQIIHQLCLLILGRIAVNPEGKKEEIKEEVIPACWIYLDSKVMDEKIFAAFTIMGCTNLLPGKIQAVKYLDEQGQPAILKKMIEKLHEKNEDLRTNIKIGLVNISELPEGFLKITRNMADQIDHLDEVFGYRGVISLSLLLPRLTDYKDEPFKISAQNLAEYSVYVRDICQLMNKYEESVHSAIEDTVNIAEKLAPFLNPFAQVQDQTYQALRKICRADSNNALLLARFVEKYGNMDIGKGYSKDHTTIKRELSQFPSLVELIRDPKIIT